MWLGVVIGLLLGAFCVVNQEPSGALVTISGVMGGVIGWLIRQKRGRPEAAVGGAGASPEELRNLLEQMRRADLRIARLEARLRDAGIMPEEARPAPESAARPQEKPQEKPQTAEEARPAEPAPGIIRASETELPALAETRPLTEAKPIAEPKPLEENRPLPAMAPPPPAPPPPPPPPTWLFEFVARWITGGNPLVKIGGLILFLGLAFLLRYVAEHSVVPIEFRYAGVAASGIALLLLGWRLRGREDSYGLILQGAGVGVLYLTTLAGMKLHPLIPVGAGFVILTGVAAFTVLLAVLQDSLALAAAASLGGFAAPVLASTGGGNHVAFFSYLTVLNLAIVAIAWFKAWRPLNLIGFFCTFFLAGAWGGTHYQPGIFNSVEPFLLLFFASYVLITFLFARRTLADEPELSGVSFAAHVRQAAPKVSYVDGTLAFGAPIATFSLQYLIVRSFENGPAFSALGFGLVYIFMAYALFRRTGMRYALLSETLIALALIFGSLAIPLGLEGKWTSAAWAIEAAGVYWTGVRQQRVHARLFALLLLLGSTICFVFGLSPGKGVAALDGSWLASLMLAASMWLFHHLARHAPEEGRAFERELTPLFVAGGCLFVALTPFLIFSLPWASTLLALLGLAAVFAAGPLAERSLIGWGCGYQALAGTLYLTALRLGDGGPALAESWRGALSAGLIGLSLLAAVWASVRGREEKEPEEAGREEAGFDALLTIVLVGGLLFINLAPLFVLPLHLAAMVWPITGVATLWQALRARRRRAALAFALGLQLAAGIVSIGHFLFPVAAHIGGSEARAFLHSGFWSPLLISLAAFAASWLLHRRKGERWSSALGWSALIWSALWQLAAWSGELHRLLTPPTAAACLIGLTAATAALWRTLARRLDWRQLGQATLAYLPALAFQLVAQGETGVFSPLARWGALAWLMALLAHIVLLRDQKDWLTPKLSGAAHVAGVWLFALIAVSEAHWRLYVWSDGEGVWASLGGLIVPLAYLWTVSSPGPRRKWPLRERPEAYTAIAALPMAAAVIIWAWSVADAGDSSAPLPYAPLLNPTEAGQIAVLLGVLLWRRSLQWPLHPESVAAMKAVLDVMVDAALGATAFMTVTGVVLRACHHWAAIPWSADALAHSMTVQTSLSIVWGVIAIGLMLAGHGKGMRRLWIAGAALIAVVVGKLFFVELAAHGSLERIVSFIAVGLLLLLVGYFAPLPPRRIADSHEEQEHPTASEAS